MNWELALNISAVLIFIAVVVILWFEKRDLAKKIILGLVIQAEAEWGSGTGKIKFQEVLGQAYSKLPMIVRIFVSQSDIEEWIEEGVQWLKTELQKGKTIEEYINGE